MTAVIAINVDSPLHFVQLKERILNQRISLISNIFIIFRIKKDMKIKQNGFFI